MQDFNEFKLLGQNQIGESSYIIQFHTFANTTNVIVNSLIIVSSITNEYLNLNFHK